MNKKIANNQNILLITFGVFIVVGITVLIAINLIGLKSYKIAQGNTAGNTFVDYNARVKILLPDNIQVAQKSYRDQGRIYISTRNIQEDKETGLVIDYTKPMIEGKGGGCVDTDGNAAYRSIKVSGITTDVCLEGNEINGIFMSNPKSKVEYYIYTINDEKSKFSNDEINQLLEVITKKLILY